jgi:hypothetical protein
VVALGDSMVEGPLVSASDLLTTRLSRLLQMEVANLGQSNYGPQQELAVLRRYGLHLHPKIVLWFFYEGNDLEDVDRYERFQTSWDESLQEGRRFIDRSFTANALIKLRQLTAPPLGVEDAARRWGCRIKSKSDSDDNVLYMYYNQSHTLSEQQIKSLEISKRYIQDAQKLTEDAGAKFLLIYVPMKFRVYNELCKFDNDDSGRQWQLNDLRERVMSWCVDHQIPMLDLTTSLKELAEDNGLVYFSDDSHWNARGQEVAAEHVARFVMDNY